MTILVIDNYDSFTYNLVQYLGELGGRLIVRRNDKVSLGEIAGMKGLDKIVISPGPGRPCDAGISNSLIRTFSGKIPILGVCLGHQCIGEVFGGRVARAKNIMHGKTSLVYHNGKDIFKGVANPFEATRYHSLLVKKDTVPGVLEITAWTKAQEVMGLEHKKHPTFGVQFHPESILTLEGKKILGNFLETTA